MGRNIPSASILLMQAKADIRPFQRGLAKSDQLAMMLEIYKNVVELREKIKCVTNVPSN